MFVLTGMVLGVAGCVSQKPMVEAEKLEQVPQTVLFPPHEIGEEQVLVECRFTEGDDILTTPQIITLGGQEAQIAIIREWFFPGSKEPVELGFKLTVLPVVKNGMISFLGSCSVKELAHIKSGAELRSASIVTRESVFSGTAAPGQSSILTLPSDDEESIKVTLKFTLVDEQGRRLGAD